MADAVGLSQSPCLVRTKRLQEVGVIRGYGADIALEKLGRYVIVFSEVTISTHRRPDFRNSKRLLIGTLKSWSGTTSVAVTTIC